MKEIRVYIINGYPHIAILSPLEVIHDEHEEDV